MLTKRLAALFRALGHSPAAQVSNVPRGVNLRNRRGQRSKKKGGKRQPAKLAPRGSAPSKQQLDRLHRHYDTGRYRDAEELAKALTKEFPMHQYSWKVLGAVLRQLGNVNGALAAMLTSVELAPNDPEAHSNLGTALNALERFIESETSLRLALKLKPDFPAAHNNLGITLEKQGKLDDAEASYMRALTLTPNYPEAHHNLGITLQRLGRLEESEASYKRAIALKPNYAKAHNNLGIALKELDRLQESEASYRRALALDSNEAETHNNLGGTLKELGRLVEAAASYRQAITLEPNYAEAHNNLGTILKDLGKFEESKRCHQQAIIVRPDYAEAHRNLTSLKTFDADDSQRAQMLEIYQNQSLSEDSRCHICFALAKASEDLGDFGGAFKYYAEGNSLRRGLLDYDPSQDAQLFQGLKDAHADISAHCLKPGPQTDELTPIFIVGMPRSGTTLVEQILSSHSRVSGAGELGLAAKFGANIARGQVEVHAKKLQTFREQYLVGLHALSQNKSHATDKMPQNFRYIGLLTAALPEAKVIHVKRDPAAVCWANYTSYFASKGISYCYSLPDILSYFSLYVDLMAYWEEKLPGKIYELDYESLVVNQDAETRNLVKHIGLDWEDACLTPQNNDRSVATASNVQVREKVYQGSSEKWKRYRPYLRGALDYLDTISDGVQSTPP